MTLAVSVLVPACNEEGAAAEVAREIASVFAPVYGDRYEILFIDDASTDLTRGVLEGVMAEIPVMRVLSHERRSGKSAALRTGLYVARGDIIVTLDGDGQNPAQDALGLVHALEVAPEHIGMAAGNRRDRQDRISKKWASRWANRIRKAMLNDGCDDTGCGLKAIRRNLYLRLPYFDQMHRYLPSLVRREGYGLINVPVGDRPRAAGASKYTNIGRLWVALSDLPGVMWLNRRRRDPGRIHESDRV